VSTMTRSPYSSNFLSGALMLGIFAILVMVL
jgi:hypothetical protein